MNERMTSELELKKIIWQSWLQADVKQRYWTVMARRYQQREQIASIFIALTSSSTVATWLASLEWIWQLFSVSSAIVAVSLPILNFSGKVATMTELATKWANLTCDYEMFWLRFPKEASSLAQAQLGKLRYRESELISAEARLPIDEKLFKQCQEDAIRTRDGLGIISP